MSDLGEAFGKSVSGVATSNPLSDRRANNRDDPMEDDVDGVRIATTTSTALSALLSGFCASAEQIADLFLQHWPLRLLFRWVKQTPKIASPFDTYEGVASSEIIVALIAFAAAGGSGAPESHLDPYWL